MSVDAAVTQSMGSRQLALRRITVDPKSMPRLEFMMMGFQKAAKTLKPLLPAAGAIGSASQKGRIENRGRAIPGSAAVPAASAGEDAGAPGKQLCFGTV
jgi:hypothetical protein